jgi:hypothetical protein
VHARGFSLAGRLVTASEFVENTIEKEMAKFERQGRSSQKRPRRVREKVRIGSGYTFSLWYFRRTDAAAELLPCHHG